MEESGHITFLEITLPIFQGGNQMCRPFIPLCRISCPCKCLYVNLFLYPMVSSCGAVHTTLTTDVNGAPHILIDLISHE
jgi:hypothetical protein